MNANEFESMLTRQHHALNVLIEDFNAGLSAFMQNKLSSHVALLKQQIAVRQKKCKEDFEEGMAKIQKRKDATKSELFLRVCERAEASLCVQHEASLDFIQKFCEESIAILRAL